MLNNCNRHYDTKEAEVPLFYEAVKMCSWIYNLLKKNKQLIAIKWILLWFLWETWDEKWIVFVILAN